MINNAALDVAIGLTLMYLMLSLLCTVINEFIATYLLNLRAKSLAAAMPELLDDPNLRKAFYDHGAIASTKSVLTKAAPFFPSVAPAVSSASPSTANVAGRDPSKDFAPATATAAVAAAPADVAPSVAHLDNSKIDKHPAYISAETFVQTLIGCLAGTRLPAGQPIPTFSDIEETIQKLPASNIKSALLSSLITANGEIEAFRKTVATWFDDSMERLSGAYKRNLKAISLLVGLLVAFAFNADTFGVASALWKDPDLRARVVSEAKDVVKGADNAACHVKPAAADASTAGSPKPGQTPPAARQLTPLEQLEQNVAATEDCLRPFPIGWQCHENMSYLGCMTAHLFSASDVTLLQFVGWLVTAAALTLGAPFWFDLLSKFVNIRGTGPKPQRADNK